MYKLILLSYIYIWNPGVTLSVVYGIKLMLN